MVTRRKVNAQIAEFISAATVGEQGARLMTPELAMTVVGGVNELIPQAIEKTGRPTCGGWSSRRRA